MTQRELHGYFVLFMNIQRIAIMYIYEKKCNIGLGYRNKCYLLTLLFHILGIYNKVSYNILIKWQNQQIKVQMHSLLHMESCF